MTKYHRELVECPHCLNEEEIVLWDVLDASQDPDLVERLLLKELQIYECQNCNYRFLLERPLLYFDPHRQLAVYYAPLQRELFEATESRDESGRLRLELAELLPLDFGLDVTDWQLRIVTTSNELIEKIHLRRTDLSDRLMEVVKIAVAARLAEENVRKITEDSDLTDEARTAALAAGETTEIRFLGSENDVHLLQTHSAAAGWQQLELSPEAYRNTANLLDSSLPDEDRWDVVDRLYGEKLLQSLSAEL